MSEQMIFEVPAYETASPDAKLVFDQLKKASGKVPNLYATIGYSGNALSSYMTYVQAQAKRQFSRQRQGSHIPDSVPNSMDASIV